MPGYPNPVLQRRKLELVGREVQAVGDMVNHYAHKDDVYHMRQMLCGLLSYLTSAPVRDWIAESGLKHSEEETQHV